jgi:hypothetical protein
MILRKILINISVISLICFLGLCLLEDFQPGFVSFWLDLRIVFVISLVSCFFLLLGEFAFWHQK